MKNKFYTNAPPALTPEVFGHPTAEYRGAPFWAWNCRVTPELIDRQLGVFREMGFGGAHVHSREGLAVPYLSDEFMSLVKHTVERSKELGLRTCLYDEDRWPSGCAGGIVTRDRENVMRYLEFSEKAPERPLAVYDIELDGRMRSFRRITDGSEAEHRVFYAVVVDAPREGTHNGESYVNTLSKKAIDDFIESTHARYKAVLGDDFGTTAPSIFTDEPEYGQARRVGNRLGTPRMPWDAELPEKYFARWNESLVDNIPLLFFDPADGEPTVRWRYFALITDIFAECYADNIGSWCDKNGILLAGHMMFEDTLAAQTTANGESMRHYRAFGIPGIDILFGAHEFTTAKQCQSVVRQYGKEGMLAELYGVTGWEADFRDYKHQGDWLAALGVTFRMPHLSWMSMKGESKRDYPASIFSQSCWYREYKYLEDHFARLGMALTRGKPIVRIAVIHPVESCWLSFGTLSDSGRLDELERNFKSLAEWLLSGGLDFDYLSESLLPDEYREGKRFGEMEYDVVIVPPLFTLRSSTVDILTGYSKRGRLIFLGEPPELVDALPSDRAKELVETIAFSEYRVLSALEDFREVDIRSADGSRAKDFLYNYREEENCRWLFIARGKLPEKRFRPADRLTIEVRGEFSVDLFDTLSGRVTPVQAETACGKTRFTHDFFAHDSLLVRLTYGSREVKVPAARAKVSETPIRMPGRFELLEPNVLLLDTAEFAVDPVDLESADWQPEEEVLRISPIASRLAGVRPFVRFDWQPWARPETEPHRLALRFSFDSEVDREASLALEDAGLSEIFVNGERVTARPDGYFIDESVGVVRLPGIRRGRNEIAAVIPFGDRTKPEAFYLLGRFGVRVNGSTRTVTALPENIGFSPLCEQLLPFYTGPLDYVCRFESGGRTAVRLPDFVGAAVRVFVDGEDRGLIAFDPYRLGFDVPAGEHELRLRLYPTRFNLLGALHNNDSEEYRIASFIWRQTGDKWTYGYRLRPSGILSEPIIEKI